MKNIATSVIITCIVSFPSSHNPATPMNVCTVLEDPRSYDGKLIAVKGLVMETLHGVYLWDWQDESAACKEKLAIKGKRWPTDIYLEWSNAADTNIQKTLEPLRRKVLEQERKDRIYGYTAEVTGILHTRRFIRIKYNDAQGSYRGNGFGNNGACAAMLDVQQIEPGYLVSEEEILLAYPTRKRD